MNKKINRSYLFLAIAILLMIKTISSITRFLGYQSGNIFSDYITRNSLAYKTGYFIGGMAFIVLFAGLSVYFFNKFKKVTQNPTV